MVAKRERLFQRVCCYSIRPISIESKYLVPYSDVLKKICDGENKFRKGIHMKIVVDQYLIHGGSKISKKYESNSLLAKVTHDC